MKMKNCNIYLTTSWKIVPELYAILKINYESKNITFFSENLHIIFGKEKVPFKTTIP